MKYLFFALLLLPCLLFSQTEKGAAPLSPSHPLTLSPSATRAVVVGISDYQSPQIQDLQFANRDAEAFAEWLQSKAGGSVPKEQIQTLLDGQATFGNIVSALEWLIDSSGASDVAIIYFSGHGDVESKKSREPGFLLPFDSPPVSYMAGAYPLYYLQVVIETLSLDKGARVVVIADACRAGRLAGASIGGAAVTSANLARQVANEVKILSCQSNEFSIEGEQWGGGRGVFSYHLVDGLTGMADQNADGRVSLHELDRYLGDKVPAETAPSSQIPMTLGDRQSTLASVDAPTLEVLRKTRAQQKQALEQVVAKGVGEQALANADSAAQRLYEQFQLALKNGDLLAPAGKSANDLYLLLEQNQHLQPLLGVMRRNLAASLQNEVQQALNALLESDPEEVTAWQTNPARYELYPAYLQRALELLGENHYLRNSLLSKKLYFEAYLLKSRSLDKEADPQVRDSLRQAVKNILLEAIRLEDRAAYLYQAIGSLYYATNPFRTDSLEAWNRKALDISPHWLLPILDIAYEYQSSWSDVKNAEKWMNEAYQIAPESYFVIERMAWLRQWQGRLDEAVELCHRVIALKPGLYSGYATLGRTYWMRMEPQLALEWALKSLNYSRNSWAHEDIISSYMLTRRPDAAVNHAHALESGKEVDIGYKEWTYAKLCRYLVDYLKLDEAEQFIRQVQDSGRRIPGCLVIARSAAGKIAWHRGEPERARQLFESAFSLNPSNSPYFPEAFAWLGKLEAEKGRVKQADSLFQKAIGARSGIFMDDFEPQAEAHYRYGLFLLEQNRLAEAKMMFEKTNEWHSQRGWKGWHGLALLAARQGQREQALDFLEKSLDCYFPIPQPITEEPLFKKIRKTKRFKAMMGKHFPK